jgi:hypothetical protein
MAASLVVDRTAINTKKPSKKPHTASAQTEKVRVNARHFVDLGGENEE